MRNPSIHRSEHRVRSLMSRVLRMLILLLPAVLLLLGVARTVGQPRTVLLLGSCFQILVCLLSFVSPRGWRESAGPSVIVLYLIALGWLWVAAPDNSEDWYPHLTQALLLIVPLFVFAVQTLTNSGAESLRQARVLAQRLAARRDLPAELAACRNLPDVKAFREALYLDATPALDLLHHERLPVRLAALVALEFRTNWRKGQVNLVVQVGRAAAEPAIRAAAVNALANVNDRMLIDALAEFLRDPSAEVRQAAKEALLWNGERRWPWVRNAFRHSFADPTCQLDGPLRPAGQMLSAEAVADLNAWASEKGVLAFRAAQSLSAHYLTALNEEPDGTLLWELQQKLADPHTPPVLRLELANILKTVGTWDTAMLETLLDPSNPASLRLLAAESLLREGSNDKAFAALHDIARLPNREIALATAEVVQRRLGVDLGLPLGQPLPSLQSRQAAEVTRRVMVWAAQQAGAPVPAPQDATANW
jgi:hypothetical protein